MQVARIDLGARVEEETARLRVRVGRSAVQRGLTSTKSSRFRPLLGLFWPVFMCVLMCFARFSMVFHRFLGPKGRRVALRVLGLHIRALIQQDSHYLGMIVGGGHVQGRAASSDF